MLRARMLKGLEAEMKGSEAEKKDATQKNGKGKAKLAPSESKLNSVSSNAEDDHKAATSSKRKSCSKLISNPVSTRPTTETVNHHVLKRKRTGREQGEEGENG